MTIIKVSCYGTVHLLLSMLSMAVVVAVVTLMVAKIDKGDRVGEWKGPLVGVRWRVDGRRAARAAAGGGWGARTWPVVVRDLRPLRP